MRYREIMELAGVKKYANMTATEIKQYYDRELGDGSIKLLGSGTHAAAIQIGNNVYKMWMQDSAYMDFVLYALNNQDNPALPKFLSKVKRMPAFFIRHKDAPDYVNYIKMEKLTELPVHGVRFELNLPPNSTADVSDVTMAEIRSAVKRMPPGDPIKGFCKLMSEAFNFQCKPKYLPDSLIAVIRALANINTMAIQAEHKLDLHSGNFMLRGDQLVIIDPIFNAKDLALNSKFEEFDQAIEGTDLDDLENDPEVKMPRAANSIQFAHTKGQE